MIIEALIGLLVLVSIYYFYKILTVPNFIDNEKAFWGFLIERTRNVADASKEKDHELRDNGDALGRLRLFCSDFHDVVSPYLPKLRR